MPKIFPCDRKFSVKEVYAVVNSIRKTANILKVSKSTVQRWLVALIPSSETITLRKRPKLMQILDVVDACIRFDPFTTLKKIRASILTKIEMVVSRELIRNAIINLEYTRKKARFYGLAKNALQLNQRFIKLRNYYIDKGHPLYSIDETGFGRFSYNKAFGYAKKGKPLFVRKVKPRMTTISVIACASKDGWSSYKTIKGSVNRLAFCEFIKSLSIPKGSVMLLDNASIHRGDIVKETFLERDIIPLYVPPYSPWYNPIEKCFSSVKRLFLEKEDVDFAMQNLTVDQHFIPYFRKGVACNGFDDVDEIANLEPYNIVDDVVAQPKKPIKQPKAKTSKKTSKMTEAVLKTKNSLGETVTIKTITTTITTIRQKRT